MSMDTQLVGASVAGGLMIGAASAGLLLLNGRIAGVSGILRQGVSIRPEGWRLAFLAGLVLSGLIDALLGVRAPAALGAESYPALAVAGLLVGLGTRLSNGCTSGHGVCGLGNLSLRSLVATATFMGVAGLTVFALRHIAWIQPLAAKTGLS
jgi:uncharacterized membrane protein YedE/YeeE